MNAKETQEFVLWLQELREEKRLKEKKERQERHKGLISEIKQFRNKRN